MEKKINIFGLSAEKLQEALQEIPMKAFHLRQIAAWMYKKGAVSFQEMTNLSLTLRQKLEERFVIAVPREERALCSADGKTTKYLLRFADGTTAETVLMRQPYGNSICVSSQAGCNMGCAFCASTLHGLERNLSPGEMFAQVRHSGQYLQKEGQTVDSVVVMGSGEPLANYDNVLAFLRLLHAEDSLQMSYRSITVSTCGIVPKIHALLKERLPITLSISLHAPNQALRAKLMPISETFPIDEVVRAGSEYARQTGRRVTYEYILIDHVNDSIACADELSQLLFGQLANVNLIPANPVRERGFQRPSKKRVENFRRRLEQKRIAATVRREMGGDIQAACGQLRNAVKLEK